MSAEEAANPSNPPSLRKLGITARRAVSVSPADLVKIEPLVPGQSLPLLIHPAVQGVDLAAKERLIRRGFQVSDWVEPRFLDAALQAQGPVQASR